MTPWCLDCRSGRSEELSRLRRQGRAVQEQFAKHNVPCASLAATRHAACDSAVTFPVPLVFRGPPTCVVLSRSSVTNFCDANRAYIFPWRNRSGIQAKRTDVSVPFHSTVGTRRKAHASSVFAPASCSKKPCFASEVTFRAVFTLYSPVSPAQCLVTLT
jgi:hypothetical protein